MIPKEEIQQVEFKLLWKDDYLKQVCGFANSQGGSIYLGVNDQGDVIGLQHTKRLLEEIPNKGVNLMVFHCLCIRNIPEAFRWSFSRQNRLPPKIPPKMMFRIAHT
jgi:hypothetical protein